MATNNLAPAPMNAFMQPTPRYPFLGGLAPQAGGSPLAKLYSYIDSMKRKGRAFTKDPLGEIAQGVQNFGEDNRKILDLQDTAYLSKSVLVTPQERDQARQELAEYGSQVGLAGTFAGVGAKTADFASFNKANKQLNAGDNPAKVWMETGWGRGPDGQMRFEISDDAAQWLGKYREAPSSKMLSHDKLYGNYPEVGKIDMSVVGGSSSRYVPGAIPTPYINIAEQGKGQKSSALHELQHAIQQREGFARGGDPLTIGINPGAVDENITILQNKLYEAGLRSDGRLGELSRKKDIVGLKLLEENERGNLLVELPLWRELEVAKRKFREQGTPYQIYKRLGGEAEARLTQSRMNLNPTQRSAQYPWESGYFQRETGVPMNELINRFDNTGPSGSK